METVAEIFAFHWSTLIIVFVYGSVLLSISFFLKPGTASGGQSGRRRPLLNSSYLKSHAPYVPFTAFSLSFLLPCVAFILVFWAENVYSSENISAPATTAPAGTGSFEEVVFWVLSSLVGICLVFALVAFIFEMRSARLRTPNWLRTAQVSACSAVLAGLTVVIMGG